MNPKLEAGRRHKRDAHARFDRIRQVGYQGPALQALLAREYRRAADEARDRAAEHRREEQERAAEAGRRIYGADDLRGASDPATFAMSFRDAQERVASFSDADAAGRALDRALRSGDALMARAIAGRAVERGWSTVRKAYAAANPEWGQAAESMSDTKLSVGLGAAIIFGVRKPAELGRMSDGDIDRLIRSSEKLYKAVGELSDEPPAASMNADNGFVGVL